MKKIDFENLLQHEENLDPENWEEIKHIGHEMVDIILEYLRDIRFRSAWQKPSEELKSSINIPLPRAGQKRKEVFEEFVNNILPYAKGNSILDFGLGSEALELRSVRLQKC